MPGAAPFGAVTGDFASVLMALPSANSVYIKLRKQHYSSKRLLDAWSERGLSTYDTNA
jgi:hypothetical protein